ncbi:MAG: polyprenyl synthetase family protein [Leptonema sp. (in: bacteria)]
MPTILKEFKQEFEFFLNDAIVNLLKESVKEVYIPALYSLLNGGKRIRSILYLFVSEYQTNLEEEKKKDLFYTASAIESLHTYTLIHDDLPAMDNDPIRRGKASCHIEFPEWSAILAGDTLNTFAFYLLSFSNKNLSKKLEILSKAIGHKGVIAGQALDLSNEKKNFKDPTKEFMFILKILESKKIIDIFKKYFDFPQFLQLLSIHYLKTAIFFKAIMELGFYSRDKESDTNQLKILSEYGESLGLLFQIQDDILDEMGEERNVGKKLKKDRISGKLTFPSLIGLEKSLEIANELFEYSRNLALKFSDCLYQNYLIELPYYILKRNH